MINQSKMKLLKIQQTQNCFHYYFQINPFYFALLIFSIAFELREMQNEQSFPKRNRSQMLKFSSFQLIYNNQEFENEHLKEIQSRISENVKVSIKEKNNTDSNFILSCLRNHFIFYNLSDAELQNVKEKMYFATVKIGENAENNDIIYDEDTTGSCFFIVQKGKLEILQNQKFKKGLKAGDGFGQIALLYHTKRKQTVRAKEDCQLWVIDRKTFREAVEEVIVKEYTENRKNLQGIRFFMNLTNDQKDMIASALITQRFYKNQTIVQQGDPGSAMYYIKQGTASVFKGNKFFRKLNKGDSFGQQSLYYNTMRQLTVKADQQVTCLVLGRDTLNRIMGDKVYQVTFKNFIRWAFQKNHTMNKLSKQHMDSVIESMKISSFKINQPIFRKGVAGFQKLVVVIQGGLKKAKTGTIVAGKCQCYGQQFLHSDNKHKVLDDQIIMHTNGVIAQISDTAFYQALGNIRSFTDVIKNIQYGKKKKQLEYDNEVVKYLQDANADNLWVLSKLSVGQFGDLYLVRDRYEREFVAKTMSKHQLEHAEVSEFIVDQSEVMSIVSFPFVVKCGKKFQSKHHLVYLTEYVKGEQFYEVLKKLGLLSTYDSQFYAASIILILEYFENIEVICRDIKPENFLVDPLGYLKLINLSTSKISKADITNKISRTFTIIGTPHYMAPDIVLGKGYTNMVDLWSLGVCLYEFLCGTLPFGDSSEGPYEIYEQIMQKDLKFPEFIHDKKAKKLIQQLLNHAPQQRNGGSFAALKNHPWFEKIQWDSLLAKDRSANEPPYVPSERSLTRRFSENFSKSIIQKKLSQLINQLDSSAETNWTYKQKDHEEIWQQFGPYM